MAKHHIPSVLAGVSERWSVGAVPGDSLSPAGGGPGPGAPPGAASTQQGLHPQSQQTAAAQANE